VDILNKNAYMYNIKINGKYTKVILFLRLDELD